MVGNDMTYRIMRHDPSGESRAEASATTFHHAAFMLGTLISREIFTVEQESRASHSIERLDGSEWKEVEFDFI